MILNVTARDGFGHGVGANTPVVGFNIFFGTRIEIVNFICHNLDTVALIEQKTKNREGRPYNKCIHQA